MADVKWIKIVTDIFDDEKMMLIEALPDSDAITVIWFKLLCLAGKQNNGGVFMLNDRIPYTDEMFSVIFRKPVNTVRLALTTFENYGMIEIINNAVTIPNWGKHQNLEGIERSNEQARLRMQKYRAKQKALAECNVTERNSNVTVTHTERDIDKELDKDKEIDIEGDNGGKPPRAPKHKYGEYKNVLLTDEELQKLKTEFSDCEKYIERLSGYIASSGKKYKSHYATIRNWMRRDLENGKGNAGGTGDKKPADEWADRFDGTFI